MKVGTRGYKERVPIALLYCHCFLKVLRVSSQITVYNLWNAVVAARANQRGVLPKVPNEFTRWFGCAAREGFDGTRSPKVQHAP